MPRYQQVITLLVIINAIVGILVALQVLPVAVVAVTGVVLGLWWAFGARLYPAEAAS
ncbi:MAG: hypothetical protein LKG20_02405 [Tetrasphaera jenkinsii]|jgi:hypothetical protein|uniref:Uncharacterized protein n=1 Tax=Nostocoides jenkinsii Ben 74 TaxID=1193518 RepID=A0A077MFB9_9MICO|nr:hypothetical protein [Tetrasphaera jenkinsii]MCI1261127.1 hypothetical protein [Tetrasphaera jenkinsii]CCI54760.1 exported hypothetical protein [Tetrasphaera jenkinsii Ben 74]